MQAKLPYLVWCFACDTVSDDTTHDTCPSCGDSGTLLNLSRLLSPAPWEGAVEGLIVHNRQLLPPRHSPAHAGQYHLTTSFYRPAHPGYHSPDVKFVTATR